MSYVVPAPLIYQELESSGVPNITPDLDACILGICNNAIVFNAQSTSALSYSRAGTFDVRGSEQVTP